MNNQDNQSLIALQVQHDDALVDVPSHPYHTRFFDVVSIIVPHYYSCAPPNNLQAPILIENNKYDDLYSSVSIISYEDAIIRAIIELHDVHFGSSIHDIKKHVNMYFMNTIPHQQPHHQDYNKNSINHGLFIAALKSLLNRKVIAPRLPLNSHSSGTCGFSSFMSYHLKISTQYIHAQHCIFHLLQEKKKSMLKDLYGKKKEVKQLAVPMKSPFPKVRLVDHNAGVVRVLGHKDEEGNERSRMEWVNDEETSQKSYIPLVHLGLHLNKKVYVMNRKSMIRNRMKFPNSKIVVSGL